MNTKIPSVVVVVCGLLVASLGAPIHAQEAGPPPLPFHSVEGCGGCFSICSAYLVNPPSEGETFGLPSVGGIFVYLNHGRHLTSLISTETLWGRVELGYAFMRFDMGDLPDDIEAATTVRIRDDAVEMHNVNARLMLLNEGAFGQSWMPALTAGIHFKDNRTVGDIDAELAGTLTAIGIEDSEGFDYTLYASKLLTKPFPRPVLINAGLRLTESAHLGLLGFTGEQKVVAEVGVAALATDRLILLAEYRQKPDEYDLVAGLIGPEDDWWTVCAGYIINSHATIAAGYGHFGHVLNHEANESAGVALKYEF